MLFSFRKIYHFLLQSNIFIAFGAACFTLQTQIQLHIALQWHPYILLIFFSGFLGYNFYRIFLFFIHPSLLLKHQWIQHNFKWMYLITIVVLLGFVITAFFAKKTVLLMLLPFGIITLLYALPIYNVKQKRLGIRDIPFLKIFIISFIWSVSTILPTVIESSTIFQISTVVQLIVERFIFIFAITIPFDIRDMKSDKQINLKTIPIIIGERKAWVLSNILLILFTIISFYDNYVSSSMYIFYGLLISAVLTLVCINHKKIRQWVNYYYILDGMIIIQVLLVVLGKYIIHY